MCRMRGGATAMWGRARGGHATHYATPAGLRPGLRKLPGSEPTRRRVRNRPDHGGSACKLIEPTATAGATSRSRWSCRTAPACRCPPSPAVEVIARSWKGLRALASPALGRSPAPTSMATSTSPAARGASSAIAESMVGAVAHGRETARAKLRRLSCISGAATARNIAHHYDVSNAFYRLWLDERMVYSCAYFRDDADTLDAAQVQKLDHICRKLRLAPGERLPRHRLRLGRAALPRGRALRRRRDRHHAVAEPVRARVGARSPRAAWRDACASSCATISICPRTCRYDKVASVGHVRARRRARFPRYFGKIHRILKPGGMVLNHGITHNSLGRRQPGQRHRRLRRASTSFPAASSRTCRRSSRAWRSRASS